MRYSHLTASLLVTAIAGWPYSGYTADKTFADYLDMDLDQLMGITITSVSRRPESLQDAAAAVYVITQEDIRRSGVTTIAGALAMAPGLYVTQISSSRWSVSSRGFPGFTSNKLLVMIDGRSVYSPAYSGTFWDMQNVLLEDIDRIEVIRGPGGTLWGANAVNGVINIITSKVDAEQGSLARIAAGTEERFQAAARVSTQLGKETYGRVYALYADHDSNVVNHFAPAGQGADANDDWHNGQAGFRIDGINCQGDEWTIQGDLFKTSGDQIIAPYWIEESPYLTYSFDNQDSEGANILGRWTKDMASAGLVTAQAYFDHSYRDDGYYERLIQTADLDLQYELDLGARNSLTMGAGIRWIDSDFDPTFQIQVPDQTDMLYSAFIQDEYSVIENILWLTLGAKYEHNDYTGDEWQPSGRLLWKVTDDQTLWASIARAVRTPSIVERTGSLVAGVYESDEGVNVAYLYGNEEYGSESVMAYETGYRFGAAKDLDIDLSLFYNDYKDLYTADSEGYNLFFTNGIDGYGYGFELVLDWSPNSRLGLTASYAYLQQEFNQSPEMASALRTNEDDELLVTSTPEHQVSLRGSYLLTDTIRLNLWLRYIDEIKTRLSVDTFRSIISIDDYFLLDANIIWTPQENLEVMLSGQNLLTDSQFQYLSEMLVPPTEIERGVYLKLTYRF